MNNSTVIYAIIITASVLLGSWLLFWGANALVWIMSLDFSPFALLTEMMSGGSLLTKFISYMLSFEWAYGLAFFYILATVGKEEGRLSDAQRLILAIPTVLIIMMHSLVYARIHRIRLTLPAAVVCRVPHRRCVVARPFDRHGHIRRLLFHGLRYNDSRCLPFLVLVYF